MITGQSKLMPVNEKTRHRRVLRKPSVYHHLGLRGNRFGGTVLPQVTGSGERSYRIPTKSSRNLRHLSSTIPPQKPVTARVVWVVGLSDDSAQHVFQPSTGVSVERGQPDE